MSSILITGARSISTLNLSRILAKAGHCIYAADTTLLHPTYFSNSIHRSLTYPSPKKDPLAFILALEKIIQTYHIEFLIPTCEEIFYIAQHAERLNKYCTLFCAPFEQLIRLHNKWSFFELQKKHGFKAAESFLIQQESDLLNPQLPEEYILKPIFSRSSQFIKKVCKQNPPKQLAYCSNNPWMAQKWLHGKQFCSYSVCHQGHITAHSCYPVRFTADGHSCISFQQTDHPHIHAWVKKFVSLENYSGQIAFDFIETEEGSLFAIECNPRTTSGLHLFDEHKELCHAFLTPNLSTITPRIGIRRQLLPAMLLFGWRKHNHHLGRMAYFKELFTVRDVFLTIRDPLPYLTLPLMLGVYFGKSLKKKTSIFRSFTEDIEWNGELA